MTNYTLFYLKIKQKALISVLDFLMAAAIGIEPMNAGVRVQCLTAWLSCYVKKVLLNRTMIIIS